MISRWRYVLDSGVVVEWLVWCFRKKLNRRLDRALQLHFLREESDFAAFAAFLKDNQGFFILSSYTLAELQRHARDAEPKGEQQKADFNTRFWPLAKDELFDQLRCSERHLCWTDFEPALVARFGPADASLVAIARELSKEGCQPRIITHERRLLNECRKLEVSAVHPDEIIREYR